MKPLYLIIALFIEGLILVLILIFLVVGLVGIFLPVMPGLLLIGIGTGLYSLLVRGNRGKVTPHIHRRLVKIKNRIFNLKISQKYMGLIKNFKNKKPAGTKEEILKYGLILFSFNIALILIFFFAVAGASIILSLLNLQPIGAAFIPLIIIFIFAGSSAVVWYRFGQILGVRFKDKKILNSSLVVLISVLPLLAVLLLFSGLINLAGGFSSELSVLSFLGLVLMSILAAVFELLLVSLGAITKVK